MLADTDFSTQFLSEVGCRGQVISVDVRLENPVDAEIVVADKCDELISRIC